MGWRHGCISVQNFVLVVIIFALVSFPTSHFGVLSRFHMRMTGPWTGTGPLAAIAKHMSWFSVPYEQDPSTRSCEFAMNVPVVVGFAGYPKGHSYDAQQAAAVQSWGCNATVVIYSDVDEDLTLPNGRQTTTVRIPPIHKNLCRGRPHWCANSGDNKFMSMVMHANATYHGRFDWLIFGDGDTTFMMWHVLRALKQHDPAEPMYFGLKNDGGGKFEIPEWYGPALINCPPLGNDSEMRLDSYLNHEGKDVTEEYQDCDAMKLEDAFLLTWGWPHGGEGFVLSRGLVDSIPRQSWQKCVDRVTFHGSDLRLSMCLGAHGHMPWWLVDSRRCQLAVHKLKKQHIQKKVNQSMLRCSPCPYKTGRIKNSKRS